MGRASNLSRIGGFTVVCLLLFVTNTLASKCIVGCHGTHPSKSYEEGKTYLYDLEGSSSTIVTDAQGEATLKLKATVELLIKPDCVRQIKLKNVQVNEAAVSAKDLERHALQFNYHDGHIDTEVCAEPGDSQASLNIKRAVISLFQSAVMQESGSTTYHETDVFGGCPTDFSFHKDGDSTIVQKHRNLGQCSHRENIREGLIASKFDTGAGIKSSPVLGAHQRTEQRFKRGILNKAVSTETYKYRPFSNGEAGAKTTIEMSLALKGDKTGDAPAAVSESKSLVFDAPHPVVDSSVGAIDAALGAVKAEEIDFVKPEAAQKFSELIKVLRASNKQDILAVYNKVKGTDDKKILLDALFRTGTGEAAEVATELIKTKEMGKVQQLMYCASLAVIRHVNLPSLISITSLLDEPDLPRICYLGIGHAIGKHCGEHVCENVAEVKEAVHKIREKVGNGKTKTREQENQIISALKALGNAKFLDDATLQKLGNIAADKNVRNRVRVAAIDALPARCSPKWKSSVLKVLADREEDSEVRITSYLSLVDCVDANVANQIKEILDKETVNQVGSFITSHLRNLRASADPNKQNAKQLLQHIRSSNKFPEDFRKFSFNNELSYSADALGLGSALESNVIYSQNSFVPRSTSLNLTAELFGHSFNFLELEARVENLDRLIERYFGPKGAFRTYDDVKKAREEGVEKSKDLYKYAKDKFEETVRGKRQVKSTDLERFAKGVHLRGTEVDEDLDLDLSIHAFGTELAYLTYQGDAHKVSPKTLIDNFFAGMKKTADKAKNFHHDFEGHAQFLDAELVYPTGMGIPMSLGIVSSGVARLKTQAKIDVSAIFKDPENAAMQLALEPSASINVMGTLSLKAFDVESGMKIVSTLHTSTGSDLSVKVLQGRGVDVSLGVPKRKQEIITVNSEVLLSSGPKGDKYVAPKFGKGKEYSDCFDQFSSILGLTVCGKLSFPYEGIDAIHKKPMFPLSGPAKFAITLENNDVSTYHFRTHYDNKDSKKRSLEILLETPNSRTNRKVSLLLEGAIEPNKYIKASFDSPIKKASAELALKNNPQERSLTMTVDHDKNQYFARIGLLANGNKYKPVLEYKVPEHIEKLAGSKGSGPDGQQYNLEGTVDLVDNEEGKKFVFENVNLVKSGRKLFGLDGHLQTNPDSIKTDLKLRYAEDTLSIEFRGKRDASKSYSIFFATSSTRDPNFGLNLSWNYKKQGPELSHNLMIVHGADRTSETNRFTLDQNAVLQTETKDFLVSGSTKIKYPALKFLLEVEGKVTPNSIKGEVDMNFEKFKAGSEFSGKTMKNGDYEGEFQAKVLENSLEVKAKRTNLAPHKYKFENSLTLTPGGKYLVNGMVTYDVKPNDVNVQLDAEIDLNGKNIKLDTGLESNEQKLNSRALVSVNKVKYVDFLLRVTRGANPNGNLNVNLKDYLTVTGQFGYQSGKGNADLNIDVPKMNRKIKGTADLTVSGSQRVANFELLYDAEKDPTKRIKLSTVSDITKTSLDTKNVFEILSQKIEVNAKGKAQGSFLDGSQSADIDVSLPNGHYIVYKLKRNFGKKGEKYEGNIETELTYYLTKGGKFSKLIYNANAKVYDPKENTYDLNWDIKSINFEGKDARAVANFKKVPNGENKLVTFKFDVTGSEVPQPINVESSLDYNKEDGKYNIKTSLGDDLKFEGHGKVVRGNQKDKPYQFEGVFDTHTSNEKLRIIKLEVSNSLQLPAEKGGHFGFKHKNKITYNDDKTIDLDLVVSQDGTCDDVNKSEGKGSVTLTIFKNPPIMIESSYKHDPTDQMKKAYADFGLGYGEKKLSLAVDGTYLPDLSKVNLGVKSTTPIEKMRNIDFQLEHKREKDGHLRKTDVVGTIDGAKYSMKSEIQVDPTEPIIIWTATTPSGKTELLFKYKQLGDREYTGEWKLETPKGFVVADAKINLEDSDNFVINLNLDSDKMKQRKIHAELANKPTPKAGRRIVITVTSDGKNIVTGSTNYKKHNEDGKIIVEGNGNLKIGDNTRSSSFKYTRQQLTREVDGEVGVAVVLNANFGPSAVVGEVKFSNKEVHVFNSYCEQSKDCAHFKLQAAVDTDRKSYMKHQITVELDLKKFNVPVEFGLKTSTEYKDLAFDHSTSLYLHSTKDKSQYVYQFYIHPKESASILTLPSREMALVVSFDLPKTRQTGAYKLDISHYLDRKNKPNDKTSLTASGDINLEKGSASLSGELKFTYPNQPKEMMMKGRLHYGGEHLLDGNLDVDVFSKKSQKISIVAKLTKAQIPKGYNLTGVVEINSRGQQLKVETKDHLAISPTEFGFGSLFSYTDRQQKSKTVGILFSINPQEAHLLITGPNKELLKSDTKMKFTKNLQKVEGEVAILGDKPHVMNFEAKDLQSFDYVHYVKGAPNNKLAATGRVVVGQLAEAHAEVYKDGNKKNLFNVLIHLDEDKFLKPDFGYNKDNIVGVMEHYRTHGIELAKQLKEASGDIGEEIVAEMKDFIEHLKKSQPVLKPLVEYYQNERNKIKEELHADATVKEIQATLNALFGGAIAAVTETLGQVAESLEELHKQLNVIIGKIGEAMKSLYPQLKESFNKIFNVFVQMVDAAASLGLTYLKAILNLINEHQKELKELATIVSELAQDVAKVLLKGYGQVKKELNEFVTVLMQQIKALPIFDMIKEKYQELLKFEIPEAILSPLEEISNAIKAILPTEELRELFGVTYEYLMKHMKRQKVDDIAEIKKIYTHAIAAVQSILALLQSHASYDHVFNVFGTQIPIDLSLLAKLPGITSLKISLLNLLRNHESPTPLDVYHAYRPTLRLADIVPPFSKTGTVIEGGHFFTFDGRHFTMEGTCDYVLAQDMKDGNFSVIANFEKGALNGITVTEPKESMTIKAEGKLLVNGKPAEYPTSTKNLHAFLIKPIANIKSDYGVHVICNHKAPLICNIRVSGFYLGKLRGLLGDGNNEPFDDYTLPSGKITESESEFGNAYKLKADCPAATAVDHHSVSRAEICTEYFTASSPMSGCFNYVKPNNYRDACDHAMKAKTPQGACLIAAAYFAACHEARVHISLPTACANCQAGANKIAIGDSFSVKIPKKEADVVFVVEQDVGNEKVFQELITPLMADLRNELKQQGITDVHVALIGFGEHMKWPQHYTTNGNTNVEGEVKNMKFDEKDKIIPFQEAKEGNFSKKLEWLRQRFDVEFGTFKLTDAYEEAIRYPFRPGAAKAVIGVLSTPCEKSPFPISLQQIRLLIGRKIYRDLGLTYYHVSFPNDILVSGKPQKNIVGWDYDTAYTLGDKKKPLEGSKDLKQTMTISTKDVCADFAISSGGAAFSSNNFLEAKPNQKKQFVEVAARRIAEGLTGLELEEDCTCTQHHGLYGKPSCKIVARHDKGATKA